MTIGFDQLMVSKNLKWNKKERKKQKM